jgi:hypothetical protein
VPANFPPSCIFNHIQKIGFVLEFLGRISIFNDIQEIGFAFAFFRGEARAPWLLRTAPESLSIGCIIAIFEKEDTDDD